MKIINIKSIVILFVATVLTNISYGQDIEAIIESLEIDTLVQNGPKDNRINWAFQNRSTDNPGNNFDGREHFVELLQNDLMLSFEYGHENAQEPYAQYRDFFNIYSFWWPDALGDYNGWHFNIIKAIRDSIFLPWATEDYGWATLFSTTRHGGGGGAGLVREKRVGDGKMYGMGWETFLHEFGHTMPGLLDEYSASGEWSGGQCWETPNTTGFLNWEDIPWRNWVDPATPLPTPYTEEYLNTYGAFEGALTNYFGCHRPTARGCFMGAGGFGEGYGLELCSPCIQRVICYLYKYVDVIEHLSPEPGDISLSETTTLHFKADVIHPEPNTQKYSWMLNGKVIAKDVTELELTFDQCETYELVFAVLDTNTLVRYDPKFDHIYPRPYREKKWTITMDNNVDDFYVTVHKDDPDYTSTHNGQANVLILGGTEPISFYHKGEEVKMPWTGLEPGLYDIQIVDANNCGTETSFLINPGTLLDLQIRSESVDDSWSLTAYSENFEENELRFLWSTGAQTASITGLEDGIYSVTVTTPDDCSEIETVELSSISEQLAVESYVVNAKNGIADGRIYLEASKGLKPYFLKWYDKPFYDLTTGEEEKIQASGTTWDHLPEYAFDDNRHTKWLHFVSHDAWISHEFSEGAVIRSYSIMSGDDVPARDPKHWLFEGSMDGQNWTKLDEQKDHLFDSRYERRSFLIENDTAYKFYRFYVLENHGDGSIQLQELEFIGDDRGVDPFYNPDVYNQWTRTGLTEGIYIYEVIDANQTVASEKLNVFQLKAENHVAFNVVGQDYCGVRIESPDDAFEYLWFGDKEENDLLGRGSFFKAQSPGNYYVLPIDKTSRLAVSKSKGFAVSVEEPPIVAVENDSLLVVTNYVEGAWYTWYVDETDCFSQVGQGPKFNPGGTEGMYYVSRIPTNTYPDPIDPADIEGIIIRMDASDLNGDGIMDDPAPATSSILDWHFENGNHWADNNWFAYRSNHQNGLGVIDFATIWLQRIQDPEVNFQTVLMVYQENPISFPHTAPFEGLAHYFPKGENGYSFLSDNTPDQTRQGKVYLNGEEIDPFTTSNPMEFCVFGARLSENANRNVFYTDTRWEGKLGELILWDHALSANEIEGVSEYLRKKWINTAEPESSRTGIYFEGSGVGTDHYGKQEKCLIISPNPTDEIVSIEAIKGVSRIKIISIDGKEFLNKELGSRNVIDVSALETGVYLVKCYANNQFLGTEKLIVK